MDFRCPYCHNRQSEEETICTYCEYPLKGDKAEQDRFIIQQNMIRETLEKADKKIRNGRIVLFILGALTILVQIVFYGMEMVGLQDALITILFGVLFIVLGWLTPKNPVLCISLGLGFYLFDIVLTGIIDPETLVKGVILKIIFIALLVGAISHARMANKAKKQLAGVTRSGKPSAAVTGNILDAGI